MSPDQVRKLVGGYATGTLTPEERAALFEAALEDQGLFDVLAREQSLRDLLGDPAAKAELLAAVGEAPATWGERAARWMWGHAPVLATMACFAMVGGYMVREMRLASRQEVAVAKPPTPPRRVFEPSVKKPAATLPALPAPPVLAQRPAVAEALPPALMRAMGGAFPRAQVPAPAAMPAQAVGGRGGGGGRGGAAGGFGGGVMAAPTVMAFGNARAAAGTVASSGTLTGTVVDSSGAAVPGAQVEARNPTTGAVRSTVSTPEGVFVFNGLEPARYSLSVRASGFKSFAQNDLNVEASAVHDLGKMPLAVGALSEEISVTAAATPVQTASSENSKLSGEAMTDLSLKGRDAFAMLQTIPGVTMGNTYMTGGDDANENKGVGALQINGSGGRANFANGDMGVTGGGEVVDFELAVIAAMRKLDPALVALIGTASTQQRSGMLVIVRITLANAPKDAPAQLKKAGFTIGRRQGNEVSGRIAVEKLETVAQLPFVAHIAPQ